MKATILSGRDVSGIIRERIRHEIDAIRQQYADQKGFVLPGLAVIQVGDNAASSIYVKNKKKACEAAGIVSFGYSLDADTSQEDLIELIRTLNSDGRIHGILCQLPLPEHMDEFEVICTIAPEKDVDGFHPVNKGLLSIGRDCLVSCTPLGCLALLKSYDIPIEGKHCVIVGRSNIVGKPLSYLMLSENATVTVAHSKTKDLAALCRQADILVSAVGRLQYMTQDYVKPGAVVIDVGINRTKDNKVRGDVDFDAVVDQCSAITPVPGGVGPMTITMLLENTLRAYKSITGIAHARR